MFLIDRQNKKALPLEKKLFSELKLSERPDLQEWIADNPSILGENLLIIQKEFDGFFDTRERLDLLALDEEGKLVIIENKLDDSGKDVVWQALKYVSYCAPLTKSEICEIYQKYLGQGGLASEKIDEFYEGEDITLNPTNEGQRIILVAANFRKEVISTVLWLYNYGIDITCVKITPYMDGDKLYIVAERVLPVDYQIRLTPPKEEAPRFKLRRCFWEKALPILQEKTGMYHVSNSLKHKHLSGASGHSGITFNPVIRMDCARAELYLDTGDRDRNKSIYHALLDKKDEIENAFGRNLDWQELPDKTACRICVHFPGYGLTDEDHWDEIIDLLADNIAKLITAFKAPLDAVLKG